MFFVGFWLSYLVFLPLSGTRPVISRSIVFSISMRPWAVTSVPSIAIANIDGFLCLEGLVPCLCNTLVVCAHRLAVCVSSLTCVLLGIICFNLGC